jgi:hypothetical protein
MSDEEHAWWDSTVLDRERFSSLVEPALARLIKARERDRLPHAVMLVGPAGLGRELAAVEAAALLVCAEMDSPWRDGPCAERVRTGVHPDVEAVRPMGAKRIITIDQIRGIVNSAARRPYEGERRVWILDGVEAGHLGAEAANAFLKTLEEPPGHAMFLLLADNPTAVLPTIRSRCQQLALPGAVAVARRLAEDVDLPELARASLDNEELNGAVGLVRSSLESGEVRDLLRLPYAIPEDLPLFSSVAAVAMEMASESEDEPAGEDLVRLAAALLQVERGSRALNLNPRGQMVSCLMRWYREL